MYQKLLEMSIDKWSKTEKFFIRMLFKDLQLQVCNGFLDLTTFVFMDKTVIFQESEQFPDKWRLKWP